MNCTKLKFFSVRGFMYNCHPDKRPAPQMSKIHTFYGLKTEQARLISPKALFIQLEITLLMIFAAVAVVSINSAPPCERRKYDYIASSPPFRYTLSSVKIRTPLVPERIRPEHLENLSPVLIRTIGRLFTSYFSECKVLSQWKTNQDLVAVLKNVYVIIKYC
ncbi:hypothetical protein DICVIV_08945 [Dictyocaulus viviparus]|uniref:Uncharacterized protein n=1 Tax=Dictyocaulus viviparus TaxID=29172 RepID=A0A0D8XMI9_DICVI|nr:hypothetical protein DICVIV_08945 [Dictyocaulus viviparus]